MFIQEKKNDKISAFTRLLAAKRNRKMPKKNRIYFV